MILKYMRKKLLILKLFVMLPIICEAQQLPQFTQYLFNTVSINPAYAGTREKLNITILNRNQWAGLNGAPVTQTLSIDSALPKTNIGLGLSAINDKLGYESTQYVYADFSYGISITESYRLTFGLKAGMSKYGIDEELLTDPDALGDQYLDKVFNKWKPNFGVGFYFRSDDWFMSLSSPRFVNYYNKSNIEYQAIERVSYYFAGGYMLEFNPQLKLKPTFLLKYTNGAPLSVDLTANFLIHEKFWIGAAYRLNDSFGGLMSFQVSDNFKFGYAYEFIASDLRPYTSGSHEIFINYQFKFPFAPCECENLF